MKYLISVLTLLMSTQLMARSYTLEERIKLIRPKVEKRIPHVLQQINTAGVKLTIVTYKNERSVEVWMTSPKHKLLKSYFMTNTSGKLGPKNKQGDRQIPEGVYSTTLLNPNSQFYLSIKLNYPNAIDKERAKASRVKDPGNNIYIHGKDKTVGCIPIGDSNIEELFYIIHKVGLRNVTVVFSPTKLPLPALDFLVSPKYKNPATEKKYYRIETELKRLARPKT